MTVSWKESKNASSLEAKFIFESYENLRDFLDSVAELTESFGIHPNISFGRDFASLIIYAQGDVLNEEERTLADEILKLAESE